MSVGGLTAALNWYRANFSPEVFGQTKPRAMPKVRCPVLGVWSIGDTALMEAQMLVSQQYVQPGQWQYVKIDKAGHWIPRDAPEQLNQALVEFLVGASSSSSSSHSSKL